MNRGKGSAVAAFALFAAFLQTGVTARAENVNGVWQEVKSKTCKDDFRCIVFFSQVQNPQTINNVSCVIENSIGGNFAHGVILGAGVNNANFKPKWDRDLAYIPPVVTFNNGQKFTVMATVNYAVKTYDYPAIRVDVSQQSNIFLFCSIAGPNNQP